MNYPDAGWMIDEDGSVHALLNGSMYEVYAFGTPLVDLAPGFYGEDLKPKSYEEERSMLKYKKGVEKDEEDLSPEDCPDVDPDEDKDDYLDRCSDEILDQYEGTDVTTADAMEVCEIAWQNRSAGSTRIKRKVHAGKMDGGMEFVLSDETPDRMDDVIMSDGWDMKNFKNNPIALFNHKSDFPIGKWKNLRVENKQLKGVLELAPFGTSERIDELRKLIDAGILRAVSVGFSPKEYKQREDSKSGGYVFTKHELVETSLVSIPANPNALAVAKSLKISPDTMKMVFAGKGDKTIITRDGANGGKANRNIHSKGDKMSLSQGVFESEKRLNVLRDKLNEHYENIDDSNVTDAQLEISNDLNDAIVKEEKTYTLLKNSERALAGTVVATNMERTLPANVRAEDVVRTRPFSLQGKKVSALDLLVRTGTVQMMAHYQKRNPEEVRQVISRMFPQYGDDVTREFLGYVQRAASAPAMTTVTGWAQELIQTLYADFMELLMPQSVYPRLSSYGLSLAFGRAGKISIPTRSRTPTIAGSFVGEGMPIPVRQGAFTAQLLTPKKMAVITTWTREIDEHSIPAIEGLLRNAIQEDTAISLDSVLLDANPATVIRPAGILNGVASIPPTAIGAPANPFNAIVTDLKNITGALMTATQGHIRSMVFLMNPQQVLSASLISAPGVGAFPFKDEIATGKLLSYPIIDSGTVPLGTVIALDAADFVSVGGEAPRFEISDQATLHMEDTAPAAIDGATPVRSLWQTDSLALRLILPINWTLRRPGMVAWVAGVTW
jgi:HK97 family phage prohead protease/HK97 family phage major capsid protein